MEMYIEDEIYTLPTCTKAIAAFRSRLVEFRVIMILVTTGLIHGEVIACIPVSLQIQSLTNHERK